VTVRYRFGIAAAAFLPDGKTVVSLQHSSPIEIWEARTGRLLREIDTGRFSAGWAYAFARGASRLAVGGHLADARHEGGAVVRVFDTASGKVLRTVERKPLDGAHAVALSPDGKLLFSLGREGKLRLEEVATGKELLTRQFPRDVGATLAVSPDGTTLALASGPNTQKLFVWKWQAREEPRSLRTGQERGNALAFSPDGKLLADCSDIDPTVRVWDLPSGRLLHKLELPDHEPYRHNHVAFSPDGKVLAAAGGTNDQHGVNLWDPATGKFLKRLDVGDGALAFSPDGTLLAAGSRVWDFRAGKELSANAEAHRGVVERVAAGPGGVVVTGAGDDTIRVWDADTGRQRLCLAHGGWIRDLALSPDGSRLVSSSLGDSVCLWDAATGRQIYRLAGHGRRGGRRAVAFAPDGKSFLSWGDDMYLRKWDVRTGKAVLEHALRPTGIRVLDEEEDDPRQRELLAFTLGSGRFTPDGKHLILEAGGRFFVFDAATGKELRHFPGEGRHAFGLAVSPDSRLLLTSGWGEREWAPRKHPVVWWDLARGKQRNRILVPGGSGGPVAFSPSGKLFAVASARPDGGIRLVEMLTGREVRKLAGFRGEVRSLAFFPDGRRLVSGMQDGSALIWDLVR
jgi:WD40 repeat protein